jgi:hypothetical protein
MSATYEVYGYLPCTKEQADQVCENPAWQGLGCVFEYDPEDEQLDISFCGSLFPAAVIKIERYLMSDELKALTTAAFKLQTRCEDEGWVTTFHGGTEEERNALERDFLEKNVATAAQALTEFIERASK